MLKLIRNSYRNASAPTNVISYCLNPQIVSKRKKDISVIKQKIIALSAKGVTTIQISDIVEDIYGFEASKVW